MDPKKNATEENVEELCKRLDAEQDLGKFLELASKIQLLVEARRSQEKPLWG